MESILISIKKLLGISEEYTHFDADIVMHINSVFMILRQLGVGPEDGFRISDDLPTWNDFISEEDPRYEGVKTYVYMKVKLVFDPPLSASVISSMERVIAEFEWRLNFEAECNSE